MDAIKLIRIALETLTERSLTLVAMAMTFALSCWTMYEPSYERMAMAAFFAISVFLPSVHRERKQNGNLQENNDGES
jgi:hypothetical protein